MPTPEHKCGITLYPRIYSTHIRHKLRIALLQRQHNRCYWCHNYLSIWWSKNLKHSQYRVQKSNAEIDHIIPRCCGGSNEIENLVAACQSCNRIRGTLFMRGVPFFNVIGQEPLAQVLERYKQGFSSNHKTRVKYNAIKASKSEDQNTSA